MAINSNAVPINNKIEANGQCIILNVAPKTVHTIPNNSTISGFINCFKFISNLLNFIIDLGVVTN